MVPLLLCAGMLVIPLVALSTSGGTAARTHVAALQAPATPSTTVAMDDQAGPGPSTTVAIQEPQVQAASVGGATAVTTQPPAPQTTLRRATAAAAADPVRVTTPATSAPTTAAPRPAPTAPPTTTAPARSTQSSQNTQSGPASYYNEAPAGTCAHPTLPFGTVVSIVDTDNGRTASCTVEDRGPYAGGRIIDLATDVFSRMAPLSQGVINVRISW